MTLHLVFELVHSLYKIYFLEKQNTKHTLLYTKYKAEMMRRPKCILVIAVILQTLFSHHGALANKTQKSTREIPQLINQPAKSEGRKLFNLECILMIKVVHSRRPVGKFTSEQIPGCLLPGATLPSPLINMPTWLSDKFTNQEVISNVDSLKMSEAFVSDKGIYIPSGAETSFEKAPAEDRKRRLLSGKTTGNRTVRAIRVSNEGQAAPSYSNAELADKIFGSAGDQFNLASGFADCTYNQLTFSAGGTDGNGVLDVNLPGVSSDEETLVMVASLQYDQSPPKDDHVSGHF